MAARKSPLQERSAGCRMVPFCLARSKSIGRRACHAGRQRPLERTHAARQTRKFPVFGDRFPHKSAPGLPRKSTGFGPFSALDFKGNAGKWGLRRFMVIWIKWESCANESGFSCGLEGASSSIFPGSGGRCFVLAKGAGSAVPVVSVCCVIFLLRCVFV